MMAVCKRPILREGRFSIQLRRTISEKIPLRRRSRKALSEVWGSTSKSFLSRASFKWSIYGLLDPISFVVILGYMQTLLRFAEIKEIIVNVIVSSLRVGYIVGINSFQQVRDGLDIMVRFNQGMEGEGRIGIILT